MRTLRAETSESEWRTILPWGILLILAVILMGAVVRDFLTAEHYRRVYRDPITVTATVTKHDMESDSEDTSYYSYISYTVDGNTYHNVQYERVNNQDARTPLGQEVTVQVSPEAPGTLLQSLKQPFSLYAEFFFLSLMASWAITSFRKRRLSTGVYSMPGSDTVTSDLMVTVRARTCRVLWLLMLVVTGVLYWRYPMMYKGGYLVAGAVYGLFWLLCMFSAIQDAKRVQNGDYTVQRDILVRKEKYEDDDCNTHYRLHYAAGGRTWSRDVTWQEYQRASEGSSVRSVYLAGGRRPVLHYTPDGSAR